MNEIVFAAPTLSKLRERLLVGDREQCAVLFANQVGSGSEQTRLLVAEVFFPSAEDYLRQGPLEAQLRPDFVARVAKTALKRGQRLVFVHTHPGELRPVFSPIDTDGEHHLAAFLARRGLVGMHATLVLGQAQCAARVLGQDQPCRVVEIGTHRDVLSAAEKDAELSPVFDRQVRAIGADGQRSLRELRVAIIGLGGTGSVVSQQLAHLGVGAFTLVDPDVVEETNLNRLANASPADLGVAKVEIAARYIRLVAPTATVTTLKDDVIRARVAHKLTGVDVALCCTDSHGSRAVVQQLAYQYLIPCVDIGTVISVTDSRITHIYGRVQLLAPGLPCLMCSGLLEANEVRRDMMTAFERQADPYLRGAREPAPAVMSLNSVASSLAVGMVLAIASHAPFATGYLLYNAMTGTVRRAQAEPQNCCVVCSTTGALARGDTWPLLARQD